MFPILIKPLSPRTVTTTLNVNVNETLNERGSRYGEFRRHAEISQSLKAVMKKYANENIERGFVPLADDQREALEMIQHKIARIINGDPNYHDSWHDIAGYATLVADRLMPPKPSQMDRVIAALEDDGK